MKTEYALEPLSRVCSTTGTPIGPGERFYAVLVEQAGQWVRKDYSAAGWPGAAPPEAVASWTGKAPTSTAYRKPSFDDDLLVNCFRQLEDTADPQRLKFRYVVALLLMRRRRLKFEDIVRADDGQLWLIVRDAQNGARGQVLDPRLTEAEIEQLQDEVFQVLGWQ